MAPRLLLMGGVELSGVDAAEARYLLARPKNVGLLAMLVLESAGRFHRRDRLVGLLWPDLDQQHARAALRKAVHEVRNTIGAEAIESRGEEEIALRRGALLADVTEFDEAIENSQLAMALTLYRDEVLPGFFLPECTEFDQWLEGERARMREQATAAAWALAQLLESDTRLTEAGTWARRAARFSGTDERVLRRTLRMLDRIGDRAGAAKLYEEFAQRIRKELDVNVSTETEALIAAIRAR